MTSYYYKTAALISQGLLQWIDAEIYSKYLLISFWNTERITKILISIIIMTIDTVLGNSLPLDVMTSGKEQSIWGGFVLTCVFRTQREDDTSHSLPETESSPCLLCPTLGNFIGPFEMSRLYRLYLSLSLQQSQYWDDGCFIQICCVKTSGRRINYSMDIISVWVSEECPVLQ